MQSEKILENSLAAAIESGGLDHGSLQLVMDPKLIHIDRLADRTKLVLTDTKRQVTWEVPSLRALWRGQQSAASFSGTPEQKYLERMMVLENQVHICAHHLPAPTDQDMLDTYSALRRRPDGRSNGLWHDLLYQATALMLGTWMTSQDEYNAILNRLERSARQRNSPGSKHYVEQLHSSFHGAHAH